MQIQSTASVKLPFINMVVYGAAGTGKTSLARTCPDPLIISAEGGLLPLQDTDLPFVEVKSMQDVQQVMQYIAANPGKYKTLVVDSLSEIAEIRLADLKTKIKDTRQVYGELANDMIAFIRWLRSQPCHTLMIAKQTVKEDESTGVLVYGPSMPGNKVREELPYQVDITAQAMSTQQPQKDGTIKQVHWLETRPSPTRVAKDRTGKLDPQIPPDFGAIVQKVFG